jgi:hypothetical protein
VAAFGYVTLATPALAYVRCYPKAPPPKSSGISKTGGLVVGCIMGSAAGLIVASIVKGGGIKLMSQKEWEDLKVKVPNPLTTEESQAIAFSCGLMTGPVIAGFKKVQSAVVKAAF